MPFGDGRGRESLRFLVLVFCSFLLGLRTQQVQEPDGSADRNGTEKESLRRRLFVDLMKAEGSGWARRGEFYSVAKVTKKVGSSSWPRKGGDLYNTGHCQTCSGIGTDQTTGQEYFVRWKKKSCVFY